MKWLTQKQVKKAAEHGRRAALLCSIKHWEQFVNATERQIKVRSSNNLACNFCALCTRYGYPSDLLACKECGLYCLRKNLWRRAYYSFIDYKKTPGHQNWARWKRASKAMLCKIIKLYESEYGVYKQCNDQSS